MGTKWLAAFAAFAAAILGHGQAVAADVGVSVNFGQPGFYGRIDIGSLPPPLVLYPQPVVIAPAPVAVMQRPIYLRVPPGHARQWSKHCGRYNACGQQTYFVQEDWYHSVYVPARRHHHEVPRHPVRVHHSYRDDQHHQRAPRHHDRRDGHGRGQGYGHGKSKGNGKGKGRD
jgi:hypothetical protein